ncbi:DUF1731 domain-containing protein [Arthrobacter sp.]|uniref:DUF1731 domain-containing protein n=1 Tax=Arthrobacter sp. TaxID=1667 RepID=UPI003A91A945
MAWNRTQHHVLALPPQEVWRVVSDPARLPEWNRAVRSLVPAHDGAPVPGTRLAFTPNPPLLGAIHSRTAPDAVVTRHEAGRTFAWRQPQPGGGLLVQWEVADHDLGTLLTQRVAIAGYGAAVFTETAAKPLAAHFAENCARLYRLAGGATDRARRVVIAGGNGFLGTRLAADLFCRGLDPVILTRTPRPDAPFRQVRWDGRSQGAWAAELAAGEGEVSLVNLAGRLVDVRPSAEAIAELRDSRVDATRTLVQASRTLATPLARWVQASTTAIYSDAGEEQLTEDSPVPAGRAALPQMTGVARPWEEALNGANAAHETILRTAVVLEQESPAFDRLALLARAGLGGRVGTGRQWFSWIHLADWLRIVRAGLGLEPGIELPDGILIASAPHPVRNAELMRGLRAVLAAGPLKRHGLPTPEPLLRLGAAALRSDPALGLTGRHATSSRLGPAGFAFEYPELDAALADITR